MTSLQGYMPARYEDLVAVFGEPEGGGDKTTVEWCLAFEDGTVATIYDWKEYETPMGLYHWHIQAGCGASTTGVSPGCQIPDSLKGLWLTANPKDAIINTYTH